MNLDYQAAILVHFLVIQSCLGCLGKFPGPLNHCQGQEMNLDCQSPILVLRGMHLLIQSCLAFLGRYSDLMIHCSDQETIQSSLGFSVNSSSQEMTLGCH